MRLPPMRRTLPGWAASTAAQPAMQATLVIEAGTEAKAPPELADAAAVEDAPSATRIPSTNPTNVGLRPTNSPLVLPTGLADGLAR
jgi:hypothetical protein